MERVREVSDVLQSEFDMDSPHYWGLINSIEGVVQKVHKDFMDHRDQIRKNNRIPAGMPVGPEQLRLHKLLVNIKSDPFIPKEIRAQITILLEKRITAIARAEREVLAEYQQRLLEKADSGDIEATPKTLSTHDLDVLHNQINDKLYERGYGIEQVEEKVNEIRSFIQKYYEAFKPNK